MADSDGAVNPATDAAAPVSFADAFAPDASPASESSTQLTHATAAEQPATGSEVVPQQGDERSPYVDRQRFDTVNDRMKRAEARAEQSAWAEQIDRRAVEQAQQIGQLYARDRAGYVRQILSEAMSDPDLAPAIRSEAARLLGTRQAQAPAGPDLDQVVIDLGNGQTVALGDLKAQWTQGVMQKLQPFVQTAEQVQQLQAQAVRQHDADTFASSFMGDLQKLPGFAKHKVEIARQLTTLQLPSDHPAEVRAATLQIYLSTVLPTLSQNAQSQLLDTLQQKAAASSSVNPTRAAPSTGRKVTSFTDPALQW